MKTRAGLFALLIALLCISGSAYSTGAWKSYTVADGLAGGNIRAITEDKRGDLWIATDGNGVSRFDGEDFHNFSTADGLPSNYVWAILEDSKGDLWFATGVGVCKYDGKSFEKFTMPATWKEQPVEPRNRLVTTWAQIKGLQ